MPVSSVGALLMKVSDDTFNLYLLWFVVFILVMIYMILKSHPDEAALGQNFIFEELMGIIREANIDFDQLTRIFEAPLDEQELRRRLEEVMQEENIESNGNNQEAAEEDPRDDDFEEEDVGELWNPEEAWEPIEPENSQQDEQDLNTLLNQALVLPLPDDDSDLNEDAQPHIPRDPQSRFLVDYFSSEEENAWPRTKYPFQKCGSCCEAELADEGSWPRGGHLCDFRVINLPPEILRAMQYQPQPQIQGELREEQQQNDQIQGQVIEQLDQTQDLNQPRPALRGPTVNNEVGGGDNNLKLMIKPKIVLVEVEQPQAASEETQPRRRRVRFNRRSGGEDRSRRPRRAPTPPPEFGLQYDEEVELDLLNQEANKEENREEPHNE